MASSTPSPATPRRIRIRRIRAAGLLGVLAIAAPALGHEVLASTASTTASPMRVLRNDQPQTSSSSTSPGTMLGRSGHRGLLGEADGAVPAGTTVFDAGVPGVANLDPALLGALRRAATGAAADGIEFFVDSGWRSSEYQERLLQQAILRYGSSEEAARWVATPTTSAHVSGDAVDIGRSDAMAWLSDHGAMYGLCQIYGNEAWHYELRTEAVDHGCPSMYADPTHDPRTRQGSSPRRARARMRNPSVAPSLARSRRFPVGIGG